jgi:hypothetical protein
MYAKPVLSVEPTLQERELQVAVTLATMLKDAYEAKDWGACRRYSEAGEEVLGTYAYKRDVRPKYDLEVFDTNAPKLKRMFQAIEQFPDLAEELTGAAETIRYELLKAFSDTHYNDDPEPEPEPEVNEIVEEGMPEGYINSKVLRDAGSQVLSAD